MLVCLTDERVQRAKSLLFIELSSSGTAELSVMRATDFVADINLTITMLLTDKFFHERGVK